MDATPRSWLEWVCLQLPNELWVGDVAVDAEGRLHCIGAEEPYGAGVAALAYERDQWVPRRNPGGRPLTGFGGTDDGSLFVVGKEGACFLWEDGQWLRFEPPSVDLRRLWGPSRTRLFALGTDCVLILEDGRWRVFAQPASGGPGTLTGELQLADVHGLLGGPAWTVGEDGTHSVVLRHEDGAWHRGEGCESWNLHRVRALAPKMVVAAGEGGVFRRPHPAEPGEAGGILWERISSRAPRSFTSTDIAARDGRPLVVGIAVLSEPQDVLVWEPNRWVRVRPPTTERITAARAVSPDILAVGTKGAVWTTQIKEILEH